MNIQEKQEIILECINEIEEKCEQASISGSLPPIVFCLNVERKILEQMKYQITVADIVQSSVRRVLLENEMNLTCTELSELVRDLGIAITKK